MFADTSESETVFAPVIQAGVEAFKVSQSATAVSTSPQPEPGRRRSPEKRFFRA